MFNLRFWKLEKKSEKYISEFLFELSIQRILNFYIAHYELYHFPRARLGGGGALCNALRVLRFLEIEKLYNYHLTRLITVMKHFTIRYSFWFRTRVITIIAKRQGGPNLQPLEQQPDPWSLNHTLVLVWWDLIP